MMVDRCVVDRLGDAAARVVQLVAELAAADELVTELVAENEELRARLARVDISAGGHSARS